MARQVLENGVILPAEYSDDWYDDMTSNLTKLDEVIGSDSEKLSSADVGAAALSNDYTDLDNKPDLTPYDTHLANLDIHVTAADKNRWNNNTYVFRYSSTALTPSSTNSNTLLDNTDNLKVGDKVIDSNGVLFSITAIDTANSTFTVGTALVDLALDANVVHTSGNETIGGIKNFTDDTYIKTLNFTNEVASPSSSSSAIMPIITTVTYTDQTASKVARINLRITASGDKSLYPHENNQYALGLTSRKWSEVHATSYYYGSSDTEFSTKFVTTDTDQDVTANKNFKGLITTTPDSPLWSITNNTTADITSLAPTCIHVERRTSGSLTDLSQGAWYVAQIGTGCFFFRQNTGTDIRYKHFPTNVVSKICVMSNDNKFISDFCPNTANTYNLGDSTYKWATINGLEPSALGMPDLSNGIDISSYIDVTQTSQYTAPANGYIAICGRASATNTILLKDHDYDFGIIARAMLMGSNTFVTYLIIPVVKDHVYDIICNAVTTLDYAKFYPCQGNV